MLEVVMSSMILRWCWGCRLIRILMGLDRISVGMFRKYILLRLIILKLWMFRVCKRVFSFRERMGRRGRRLSKGKE
jgi:hypothetical protein